MKNNILVRDLIASAQEADSDIILGDERHIIIIRKTGKIGGIMCRNGGLI